MSEDDKPRDSWLYRLKGALGLKGPASLRDGLEDALEEGTAAASDEAAFGREERRILRNLLAARDRRVQDVMVPRGAIIAVAESASFAEVRALLPRPAIPPAVHAETLDDPRGMIHIRDLFARLDSVPPETTLAESGLVRPVLFAPGTMPALDLLLDMQARRIHMALVIDEYGATDGLVSLEDLVEIIVGEIEDEHDVAIDPDLEAIDARTIAIDAAAPIETVATYFGLAIEAPSEDHEIETIGGYLSALLGRVPEPGETHEGPEGLRFVVLEGDARRLHRLRIERPAEDEMFAGGASG